MRIWKPVAIEDVGLRVGKEKKREKFVAADQWEITELSPERKDLSSMGNAGVRDLGWQVSGAQGQTLILPFHVCIGPWKLHPSGKWLNENSLTSLSLQVVFIALLPCSFSRTARFTANPTSWGWYASGGV